MNKIVLTKEQYNDAVEEIRRYFACEMEEPIGNLQGQLIIDFILEKIGLHIYNQAIIDMQKYMNEKVDDMYAYMI